MKLAVGRLLVVCGLPVLLASVLLVACGGSKDNGSSGSAAPTATPAAVATTAPASTTAAAANPTAAGGLAVTIVDFSFSPAALTAKTGPVTVNVKNSGAVGHTFTIDGVTDSGTLAAGSSKTLTFNVAQSGTLTFYCQIHGAATMSGKLTVSAGTAADPALLPSDGSLDSVAASGR